MKEPGFLQEPPAPSDPFAEDRMLRSYLKRVLPAEVRRQVEPELAEMGQLAAGELFALQAATRTDEPTLTRWDAWGRRVDRVEVTKLWQRAERLAARRGLVATAYEGANGRLSRIHQFALVYLFAPSTDFYGCPLAMTDGAARCLLDSGHRSLIDRAVPRLTSRDPERFWTSGQWMTETSGGSDVSRTGTVARPAGDGSWLLTGRKWFTSGIGSQMALTLARPEREGAGSGIEGGRGLALFYLETRDAQGLPNGILVERLKDKLGTRKVPTAELLLDGARAQLVGAPSDGVRAIAPMLNITRTWNAVSSVALLRRGLALARDYAKKRHAFGSPLAEKPLHLDTLAGLQAELEGAFHLTFRVVELLGRLEAGECREGEANLLRVLTPLAKLTTAKQAVAGASELLEAFGGAGYVEDTGLPQLLRDAQVLPIWEGTTNVLALDALRALRQAGGIQLLQAEVERCLARVRDSSLEMPARTARFALEAAERWLAGATVEGLGALEAGARRFALTAGRALELALLVRHAQWSLDNERDARAAAAARRLVAHGIQGIVYLNAEDATALAQERPLPAAEEGYPLDPDARAGRDEDTGELRLPVEG